MPIPKIIHQTYKTWDAVPEKWAASPAAWKSLHPAWEYRFWSDADLRNIVITDYPWFLARYDSFPHVIQRVDAARYFILDKFGGIYSDLDIVPLEPMDPWVDGIGAVETAFTVSATVSSCITNSFMASVPRAAIWPLVHLQLTKPPPWWAVTKHFRVMTTTGPMMLNSVVRTLAPSTIAVLPPLRFSRDPAHSASELGGGTEIFGAPPPPALAHTCGESWCGYDTAVINFLAERATILAVIGVFSVVLFCVALTILAARSVMRARACEARGGACNFGKP